MVPPRAAKAESSRKTEKKARMVTPGAAALIAACAPWKERTAPEIFPLVPLPGRRRGACAAAKGLALPALERVQRRELRLIDEAVRPALRQPRLAKVPSICRRRAMDPALLVADHVVLARVGLDVGEPAQEAADLAQPAAQVGIRNILEDVGADDEIERAAQLQRRERAEAS